MCKQFFLSVIFVFFIVNSAYGTHFRIVFTEGENTFNYDLPLSELANKYLAKVQLFKDGELILDDVRGSTLSDSIFYYQLRHTGIEDRSPTDDDIQKIFEDWDTQVNGGVVDSNLMGFLQDINAIIKFYASVPVVWSGKYNFVIGLHKNGSSVHGQPYVPRLQGTWNKDTPYNANNTDNTDEQVRNLNGVWLATVNANKAHEMKRVAAGINVHDGRRTKDYRDSEGCLTIHPDDWSTFINILPNIETWKSKGHTGEVIVIRRKPSVQSPESYALPDLPVIETAKGFKIEN